MHACAFQLVHYAVVFVVGGGVVDNVFPLERGSACPACKCNEIKRKLSIISLTH